MIKIGSFKWFRDIFGGAGILLIIAPNIFSGANKNSLMIMGGAFMLVAIVLHILGRKKSE